jgi:acid stress-induced BolA-like protein IbaG/YrbA
MAETVSKQVCNHMEIADVQQKIAAGLPGAQVMVSGDGSHFEAVVVWAEFEDKTPVQKQKMVYATVNDDITSGALHALSIKAYTPEQWEKAKKFQVGSA